MPLIMTGATIIQFGCFYAYNNLFHPFKDLLTAKESDDSSFEMEPLLTAEAQPDIPRTCSRSWHGNERSLRSKPNVNSHRSRSLEWDLHSETSKFRRSCYCDLCYLRSPAPVLSTRSHSWNCDLRSLRSRKLRRSFHNKE